MDELRKPHGRVYAFFENVTRRKPAFKRGTTQIKCASSYAHFLFLSPKNLRIFSGGIRIDTDI